jgi:ABC-type cobalamin/Fe3+-siderophores transport system ATPase subunit
MARLIDIKKFSVRVGARNILDITGLSVESNEFVALLGPNGAGKTTFIQCCLGMARHVQGEIKIFGRDIMSASSSERNILRRRIAYVPQLLPPACEMPLTVREVISTGRAGAAGLFRRLGNADKKIIEAWIDSLGLNAISNMGYAEISGGEQRKTLIARAMVQQPEILLLDEPAANLDLQWREKMVKMLAGLYEREHITVIMVCHELEALPPCCRRVVILDTGRIIADGGPVEIFTDERIRMLYGEGLTVMHNSGRYAVVPKGACNA